MNRLSVGIGSAVGVARKRAQQGSGRSKLVEVAQLSEQELIEAEACNPFDASAGHQRLFREGAALADPRRHELRLTPLSNPAGNDSPANSPGSGPGYSWREGIPLPSRGCAAYSTPRRGRDSRSSARCGSPGTRWGR